MVHVVAPAAPLFLFFGFLARAVSFGGKTAGKIAKVATGLDSLKGIKKRQKLAEVARQAEQPVVVQATTAAPGLSTNTVLLIVAGIGLGFAFSSRRSKS